MPPFHSRSTGALRIALISSAGVIASTPRVDAERRTDRVVERDPLQRARVDAAALGDQALVVVLPARPRQLEEPLALGVRRRGVGRRVEEDVAVVEGGHQQGLLGAEQAVAEDVTGHVADADAGELLGLAVDAALAEVPLHRDPRAAGGDAHRLVVVADRAAAGERVAEPEPVVLGDAVGDVGERRRALVGRDHQVGVVAVVAYDVARRHGRAVDEVVGDVEQAGDEGRVAGDRPRPATRPGRRGRAAACRRTRPSRRPARSRCSSPSAP